MAIKIAKKQLKKIECAVFKTCIDVNVSKCSNVASDFEKNLKRFYFTFAAKGTCGVAPGESM